MNIGSPVHVEVIQYLAKVGKGRSQTIAEAIERHGFVVSGSLARLEKRGGVKKIGKVDQGRVNVWLWEITEKGRSWAANGIPKGRPEKPFEPGEQAELRARYELAHEEHVKRQRRMGLTDAQISGVFALAEDTAA